VTFLNTKRIQGWTLPNDEIHFAEYLETFGAGHYQRAQRLRALSHCKGWRHAIDIGGSVGLWSKDLCYFFRKVSIFEPNEVAVHCLHQNLSGFDNYEVFNVALSDEEKEMFYWSSPTSMGGNMCTEVQKDSISQRGFKSRLLKTSTLNKFNLNEVDFIKIDVQFNELECLKGGSQLLLRNRPIICVECCERTPDEIAYSSKVFSFLIELGYKPVERIGKEVIFMVRN